MKSEIPATQGRLLSGTAAAKTEQPAIDFLKSVEHKFPVIQWTPRVDAKGNATEMLVYHNKFMVKDDEGVETMQELYLSDQDLNQEGPTKIYTPQPNSVSVEWAWVNLADRQPQPLDFKVKMMTLPEINEVNSYLDDPAHNTVNPLAVGNESSFTKAFFETVLFSVFLGFMALVGTKIIEEVQNGAETTQKGGSAMEYECEEESEMRSFRTRSTYLR